MKRIFCYKVHECLLLTGVDIRNFSKGVYRSLPCFLIALDAGHTKCELWQNIKGKKITHSKLNVYMSSFSRIMLCSHCPLYKPLHLHLNNCEICISHLTSGICGTSFYNVCSTSLINQIGVNPIHTPSKQGEKRH
jgi:hypothetical protein